HRETPQQLPFSVQADFPRGLKNLYLRTDWGVLDCLAEVKGVGDYAVVLRRSLLVELPIGPSRILDLEALIEAKNALDRAQGKLAAMHTTHIQQKKRSGGA